MAIEIKSLNIVEITEANIYEVCDIYDLDRTTTSRALSFAWHYNKLLYFDVDNKVHIWIERVTSTPLL